MLTTWPLSDSERFFVGAAFAEFGVDSRSLARIPIFKNQSQITFVTFEEAVELLMQMPIAIYKSRYGNFAEGYSKFTEYPGCVLIRLLGHVWHMLELSAEGIPIQNFSLIDLLHRTAIEKGLNVRWKTIEKVQSMDIVGHIDVLIMERV
jgi:hypothetical protein